MPTQQSVADGGRSTFTVQNNRDFPATAIGVFSAEAARRLGITRFDTAAAKRLLATKGMNVLRTPVTVKQGGKATLDVQFPGCYEDWDAFVALTRPGYEDTPVLKYVQTEFYRDPSAPIGSHHVKGDVVLNPPKNPPSAVSSAPQRSPTKSNNAATAVNIAGQGRKEMSRITETSLRRIVRELLAEADSDSKIRKSYFNMPSRMFGAKPYEDTEYSRYLERALEIMREHAERVGGDILEFTDLNMAVGPVGPNSGPSLNGLIIKMYATNKAGLFHDPPEDRRRNTYGNKVEGSVFEIFGGKVEEHLNQSLAQAAREMGVEPAIVNEAGERSDVKIGRGNRYQYIIPLMRKGKDPIVHTVKRGENMIMIAKKYGVSPDEIAAASSVNDPDLIRPGQKLTIPQR